MIRHRLLITLTAVLFVAGVSVFLCRASIGHLLAEHAAEARRQWRLEQAIDRFDASLFFSLNDEVLFQRGLCHQLRGDFLAAERDFGALAARDPEERLRARLHNALGGTLFKMNRPDEALQLQQQALAAARAQGDRRLEAAALIDAARILYHAKGRPVDSQENLELALRLARDQGEEMLEAHALRHLGVLAFWFHGRLEEALHRYSLPALEIYRRLGNALDEAVALSNIGLIHLYRGDSFQSFKNLNESLQTRQRIGDQAGLSESYAHVGGMYLAMKSYGQARQYYSRSLEITQRIGYRLQQSEVEVYLADIHFRLGDFDEAIALILPLLEVDSASPALVRYRLQTLGRCYLLQGQPLPARREFERARAAGPWEPGQDGNFRLWNSVLLGRTYAETADWAGAERYLREAEEVNREQELPVGEGLLQILLLQSELAARQNRHDQALSYMLRAAELDAAMVESDASSFAHGRHRQLYDRLFFLLADADGASAGGEAAELLFRHLEQWRHRSLRQLTFRLAGRQSSSASDAVRERAAVARLGRLSAQIRSGPAPAPMWRELREAYREFEEARLMGKLSGPWYRLVEQARPAGMRTVQRTLAPDTALVQYILAGDAAFALVLTRERSGIVALPVSQRNLEAKIQLLGALLQEDSTVDRLLPVAEELRRILVGALEESGLLEGIRRLGLVPFGRLHELAFAALARRDGDAVRFLVQDYLLFFSPTASFLAGGAGRPAAGAVEMLSVGRNVPAEPGLPPLQFAVEEARAVGETWQGLTRVGSEATEAEFKQLAGAARRIHVAAHAVSEPEMPLLSRLLLGSGANDDGNLIISEVLDLGLQAELVSLGACRTGLSFPSSGQSEDELARIGLVEAFLYAGVDSVLASLLPISDRHTSRFMIAYHEKLRGGLDRAEALAETQRDVLRHGKEDGTHPRHWAPFVLVGRAR